MVEFNPKSETIQGVLQESRSLWVGTTSVVAMGDLLTLGAFSMVPPITKTLVGAFSTEREALDVHIDGIAFVSSIGKGIKGDFFQSL